MSNRNDARITTLRNTLRGFIRLWGENITPTILPVKVTASEGTTEVMEMQSFKASTNGRAMEVSKNSWALEEDYQEVERRACVAKASLTMM